MQTFADSVLNASWIMLVATGFALIYRCARFFHIAHGAVFTGAAYFMFSLTHWLALPVSVAAPLAVVLGSLLGCEMEICVFRPLRRQHASSLVGLLASLGVYIVVQSTLSTIFGDDTKTVRTAGVAEGLLLAGARITSVQIVTFLLSVVVVSSVAILLRTTRIGMLIRAVANDPELSVVHGVENDRTILLAFALGSALASLAGILVALDVDMTPSMGLNPILLAVVAVIIGGADSTVGIALASLLIGVARHGAVLCLGSEWQDATSFTLLLVVLLVRPRGLLGRPRQAVGA